ncbi:MAG: hypothetical protein Q7U04_04735, partial [Bacteriovorax sp.]|nr:hypothetical protein [Bacteriovorax sp.]
YFLFFQSPWTWVSAPVVIFCRYDFFPELLSFKFLGKKLILLSAASKKPSWFKSQSIELFSLIVAANNGEARYFKENFPNKKIHAFDFRVPRIFKRVEQSTATLARIVELKSYLKFLDERSPSSKLILGSSWESDLVIIKNSSSNAFWIQDILNNNIHLLIVPHNLGSESVSQLKNSLGLILPNVPVYEISKAHEFEAQILNTSPGIVILNMSGVLCELYTKFSWAYVGGGYERSIHSVLEPFLSGCQVICGPKVNRSTEFDFIKDFAPNEIELLKNAESFYNLMKEKFSKAALKSNERVDLRNKSLALMESIIKEIELC